MIPRLSTSKDAVWMVGEKGKERGHEGRWWRRGKKVKSTGEAVKSEDEERGVKASGDSAGKSARHESGGRRCQARGRD
jgi:hypothetical protein